MAESAGAGLSLPTIHPRDAISFVQGKHRVTSAAYASKQVPQRAEARMEIMKGSAIMDRTPSYENGAISPQCWLASMPSATDNTLLHIAYLGGMSIAKSQLALQSASDASAWQASVAAALGNVSFTRDCRLSMEGKGV